MSLVMTLKNPASLDSEDPEESNPVKLWRRDLKRARQAMDHIRYDDAIILLEALRSRAVDRSGPGVDDLLATTLALLGDCYFHIGDAEEAVEIVEEARKRGEERGDIERSIACLKSLFEIHRYKGDPAAAAACADRLADAYAAQGQSAKARRFLRIAQIVRAGEPPLRVVAVVDDRPYEIDEAPRATERTAFSVEFVRDRTTLRPAAQMIQRGEELGSRCEYERALAAFRTAAAIDPLDPECRYLAGLTLLHLGRYQEAAASYDACEARAPGWFECRAGAWLARELAKGRLDHKAFTALRALEDGPGSPAQKVEIARSALDRYPSLAPLYLFLGLSLRELGKNEEAEAALRGGLARAAEPDVRTRLLLQLALLVRSPEERRELLEEAVRQNGNLVAAATARLLLP